MRLKTLVLATALSALAGAAAAGPGGGLGGGIGGGLGGGLGGGIGGGIGGGFGHGGGGIGGGIGAGGGGGIGGGLGGAIGGGAFGGASSHANSHATTHVDGGASGSLTHGVDRSVSGALHASDHANGQAGADVVGRGAEASADGSSSLALHGQAQLAGLSAGETVTDARGDVVGTVDSIERTKDGMVTGVLVTTANGERRLLRLEPGLLRVAHGVVTTTESLGVAARGSAQGALESSATVAGQGGASVRDVARTGRMATSRASATGMTHADANAGFGAASSATARPVRPHAGRLAERLAERTEDRTEATASEAHRDVARAGRMGPLRASATGVAHANEHAGLAAASGGVSSLTSLTTGMTVRTANGMTLGTVSRVVRSADGTVRTVLVRSAGDTRRMINLAPRSLSVSGGVVTTTEAAAHLHG